MLRADSELYVLMQICQDKHCWLGDLENIPSDELPLWIAFYDLEHRKRKKESSKSS